MTVYIKHVFTKYLRLLSAVIAVSTVVCLIMPSLSSVQAVGGVQLKKKTLRKRIDAKGNLVEDKAVVEDMYDEANIGSITQLDPRAGRAFFAHTWFIKASTTMNYFNLGQGFKSAINQIQGAFTGDNLNMQLATSNPSISMQTADQVQRAPTYFLPTGNMSLGFYFGKHQIELEMGFAGLVPLNTINLNTTMTLTDKTAGCSGTACDMAAYGFVNPASRTGQYAFKMNMNENVWILTPSFTYDYIFLTRKWGRMSFGGAVGAMILSTSQQIVFSATRTDLTQIEAPTSYQQPRILQGSANSTNVADIGPIFRLHLTYRPPPISKFWNTQTEFRIGANYGWVYMNRDIDGSGQAVLANGTLNASFPMSSLGFQSHMVTKFEMVGGFIQAGIVF